MRKSLLIFLLFLIPLIVVPAVAGTRSNYVYDYADILTDDQQSLIHDFCLAIDENTTAEIVVMSIENLDEYGGDIDLARVTIFNEVPLDGVKGIGKAGEDNGILILVAMVERAWGIEVGYGLEGDLTDSECGRIGRDVIVVHFKDEEYFEGLLGAVKSIAREIGYAVEDDEPEGLFGIEGLTEELLYVIVLVAIVIIIAIIFIGITEGSGYGSSWSSGSSSSSGGGGGSSGGGGGSGSW